MKRTLFIFAALYFSIIGFAQKPEQGFEAEAFPPQGWKAYNLPEGVNQNGWSRKAMTDPKLPGGGGFTACSLSGRSKHDTDSWLITPAIQVERGDYLQFYLSVKGAYDTTLDTLDVLISETTSDKESFETRILRVSPKSELNWSKYNIDLSAYTGKQIYIAFRDHLLSPPNFISGCTLLIDKVSITQTPATDLGIVKIASPVNNCADKQFVELTVNNTGIAANNVTVCYRLNNGETVKEEFKRTIDFDSPQSILLKSPVSFEPDTKNRFQVWLENQGEGNLLNDTLSTDVSILKQLPYPYDMSLRTAPDQDFASYGGRIKWTYALTTVSDKKVMAYSGLSGGPILGSYCMNIPAGKVRVVLTYASSQHAVLDAYSATMPEWGGFTRQVGHSELLTGDNKLHTKSFVIDAGQGGLQSLGFQVVAPDGGEFVTGPSTSGVMFVISDLKLEPLTEDLALTNLTDYWGTAVASSDNTYPVRITVSNTGLNEQKNFKLCYQAGEHPLVTQTYTGILKEGEATDFTFAVPVCFKEKGKATFRVWLESENDTRPNNNEITRELNIYEPESIPYSMGFEDNENFDCWTAFDVGRNGSCWKQQEPGLKGTKAAFLPFIKDLPNDDYLISPATYLPKGKARIAFYNIASSAGMKLDVLMGNAPSPDSLKTTLRTAIMNNGNWLSESIPLDITQAGYYYFAFRGQGVNGRIGIEDVRIDAAADACIRSVNFDRKSGYNLTSSAVKIVFVNNGATPIKKMKVSYSVNGSEAVVEPIQDEIAPGEQLEHTFETPANIASRGIYKLRGKVLLENDSEPLNNAMGASLEHYKNKPLPYFQGFDDLATRLKWQATCLDLNSDGNSWLAAGNAIWQAYSNGTCLNYDSNQAGDDWIFSECIEMPAGEMDFSFFYRTYKNITDRVENFKVMLGTSPDPQSMILTLADLKGITVSGLDHKKFRTRFTLSEGGKYYLGFYTDSPASKGYLVIDDILLEPYKALPPFYISDFTKRFEEWTVYKPMIAQFDQWTLTREEGKEGEFIQMKTFKSNAPGLFVSPGFQMEKDIPVRLDLEYALITPNEKDTLGLYMGCENHPDSLTTLVTLLPGTTGWTTAFKLVNVEKSGRYFFAFKAQKAANDKNVLYKIGEFKLTPAGLKSYELKGKVTEPGGTPVSGLPIMLKGGQSQQTQTDENGLFSFPEVLEKQNFTLMFSKEGFMPFTKEVKLDGAPADLGELKLSFELLPPVNAVAAWNADSTEVRLTWMAPGSMEEYVCDDGIPFGQAGFNSGTSDDVMGTVFRTPAQITRMSWFTTSQGGPHEKVNAYVLDLDPEGNPTGNVLYKAIDVPNKDMEWTVHTFPQPVNAPNGFMIAVSYSDGSLGLGIDDGIEDFPFTDNTCYVGNLSTGKFLTLESQGGKSNFLLRATGIPGAAASAPSILSAGFDLAYNVYRFEYEKHTETAGWELLTKAPASETSYTDETLTTPGTWGYAIKAVYPTGELSSPLYSNTIIRNEGSGIGQISLDTQLILWPVPATENVYISTSLDVTRYVLCNATGAVVSEENLGGKTRVIPVGRLEPGAYLVTLFTSAGTVTKRLVKK